MNWLNQDKALFVCLCYMATFLQLRVNNPPCPRKRMQINLHKIHQFWDTNKQGGGGVGGRQSQDEVPAHNGPHIAA